MRIAQGDIIIAIVRPPRGEIKRRPAVVVTPTSMISANSMIKVVGISTSYWPQDPTVVPLGWRADGRIHTRLLRDSAACANLLTDLPQSDLERTGGHLSKSELINLLEILKRLGTA